MLLAMVRRFRRLVENAFGTATEQDGEESLVRWALARDRLSQESLRECLGIKLERVAEGRPCRLESLFVEREILTEEETRTRPWEERKRIGKYWVRREIARGGERHRRGSRLRPPFRRNGLPDQRPCTPWLGRRFQASSRRTSDSLPGSRRIRSVVAAQFGHSKEDPFFASNGISMSLIVKGTPFAGRNCFTALQLPPVALE